MATSNKSVGHAGLEHLAKAGVIVQDDQLDVQKVAESDLARVAGEEAFMRELVTIRIAPSINPNDTPYAVVTPVSAEYRRVIPRGAPTQVMRMHVEVLARMKEVRYAQRAPVGGDLETGNMLYQTSGVVYPFEVVEDKNPKGRAWLDNILAEPA